MRKLIGRIIEWAGYLAVVATYVLFYLTRKKMGVQRDFIFRNKKWMDGLFTGMTKYIFIAIVLLGLFYLGMNYLRNRKKLALWQKLGVMLSIGSGIMFEMLLVFSGKVGFVGLPMLLVSIFMVFLGRVIGLSGKSA